MPRIIRLLSLFYMLLFLSTQGPCLAETVETTTPEVHSGDSVERLAIAVENLARLFANQATEEKENKEDFCLIIGETLEENNDTEF